MKIASVDGRGGVKMASVVGRGAAEPSNRA